MDYEFVSLDGMLKFLLIYYYHRDWLAGVVITDEFRCPCLIDYNFTTIFNAFALMTANNFVLLTPIFRSRQVA